VIRFVSLLAALLLLTGATAHAQVADIPRTADGRPDFHGYWSNEFLTPLERIAGATAVAVSDAEAKSLVDGILAERATNTFEDAAAFPEAKQLAKVKGEWRTSLVVDPADGILPLTPEGKALRSAFPALDARIADNYEERANTERCFGGPSRAPIMIPAEGLFNQIVQTPDALVFLADHYADLRVIGIGKEHRAPQLVAWAGDSIASWDGDMLVVETINLRPDEPVRHRLVFGPQSRIVERFRLIAADELLYQFTIEDPAFYERPWTAEYSFTRTNLPVHEFACHEGNYGLPNILLGARREAQRQAEAAAEAEKAKGK
jgi:hypothetical protein